MIWRGVFYLRVRSGKLPRLYRITKKKRMEIDIYRTRSPVESQNGLVQKVMHSVKIDSAAITIAIGIAVRHYSNFSGHCERYSEKKAGTY